MLYKTIILVLRNKLIIPERVMRKLLLYVWE